MPTNDISKKRSLKKTLVAGVVAGTMATSMVAPASAVAVENAAGNTPFLPTPSYSAMKDNGVDSLLLDFSLGEAILPTSEEAEFEGFNQEGGGGPVGGGGGGGRVPPAPPATEPETADDDEDDEDDAPTTPSASTVFNDIHAGHWFYEAINFVLANEIMIGVSNYDFAPNAGFNRAMAATVLFRMAEAQANFGGEFGDVAYGRWYSEAVTWAAENGIVLGVGDGQFDPYANITREQLATMLFRFATLMGFDMSTSELSGFVDIDGVSDWAQEAMSWAVHHGIFQGDNNRLNPGGTATRAEVATILKRVMTLFD